MSHVRSNVAVLILGLMACGRDGAPGAAERGVIRNENGDNVPGWTVSSTPLLDIGGGDDQALVMVTAGAMRGDEIIVADVGAAALRWFDRAGRPIRTVGERGSGPGQFQFMGWMGLLPGDSVAVWDPALLRLSVFDARGKLGRVLTLRFTRGSLPPLLGAFDDGTLLVGDAASAPAVAPGTVWRDTLVYLRVGRDGAVIDTLGRFPGAEWYAAAGPGGRVHSRPFGRQVAAGVNGNRFYVGAGDEYEVVAFAGDGTEQARFRKPHRPVGLSPDDISEYQSTLIQVGGTAEERHERARELREAPYPQTLPPYTGLVLDTGGNVWVREPYPPGKLYQASQWSVFDSTGRWIATAQGPGRFQVLQIGPDWVLGTQTDENDVEHVRLYPLIRGNTPKPGT